MVFLLFLALPHAALGEGSINFYDFRVLDGWLEVDFRFQEGLSGKVIETLERGLPATIQYEVELWRTRSSWFDKLEASRFITYEIRFDVIEKRYESRLNGSIRRYATLAELDHAILRQAGVRVAPISGIHGENSCFFSITAKVIPVDLEQVREMEAWLDGKIPGEEAESGGAGGILRMPERLFGFVASVAGFGDEEIKAKSIYFVPEALE